MKFVVVGAGAVGARAGRQLLTSSDGDGPPEEVVVVDTDTSRLAAVVDSLGPPARAAAAIPPIDAGDAVLLAMPGGHRAVAEAVFDQGGHVVSVSDNVGEVRSLLGLDTEAGRLGL